MSAEKIRFARAMIDNATRLSQVLNASRDLAKAYATKGYSPGGSNPISDADLNQKGSELFVLAADVAAGVGLAETIVAFLTSATAQVARGDHAATLAKLRGDL